MTWITNIARAQIKQKAIVLLLALVVAPLFVVQAQGTVFSIFESTDDQANAYFNAGAYQQALDLYLPAVHASSPIEDYLRIAQCYYHLHQPAHSTLWYERYLKSGGILPESDIYLYAESLSALGRYDEAINWYDQYLQKNNDDPVVIRKVWRLKNKESLYEDSVHYVVKKLSFSSSYAEFAPAMCKEGIVFLANRPDVPGEANHYKLYLTKARYDTIDGMVTPKYGKPAAFARELRTKFNQGPVAFYDSCRRMVYVASGDASKNDKNKRTLELWFAELQKSHWIITGSFPFNSTEYSVTDPAVSSDGKVLYFSSDMPNGLGGKDLYRSTFDGRQWSKPVNLGDQINTSGDESFPFIAGDELYFASDGHPGLGGLDIFHATLSEGGFGEAQNMGYPVNTHADDFAIILNGERNQGYISSNRQGNNDDIYSLSINLQSYPMTIKGLLQVKDGNWSDSTELKVLPNAQLFLIDNNKDVTVQTSTSNSEGNFTLTIPYFSQYKLKVVEKPGEAAAYVSFDLSKQRNAENLYKMVVVKKSF